MRILQSNLDRRNGLLAYKGESFTGIAYEADRDSGMVVSESIVASGEIVGLEGRWTKDVLRIILPPVVSSGPEPLLFEGETFSGVVYEFDEDGTLTSDAIYEQGLPVGPFHTWHPSGCLGSRIIRTEFGENGEEWFETGQLRAIHRANLSVIYRPSGGVVSLYAGEKCETGAFSLMSLVVGERLRLQGNGVSDQVVAMLCPRSPLTHLTLEDTVITSVGLRAFQGLRLSLLTTENNAFLPRQVLEEFVSKQNECVWDDLDI